MYLSRYTTQDTMINKNYIPDDLEVMNHCKKEIIWFL